jgi:hypothetical protein
MVLLHPFSGNANAWTRSADNDQDQLRLARIDWQEEKGRRNADSLGRR